MLGCRCTTVDGDFIQALLVKHTVALNVIREIPGSHRLAMGTQASLLSRGKIPTDRTLSSSWVMAGKPLMATSNKGFSSRLGEQDIIGMVSMTRRCA